MEVINPIFVEEKEIFKQYGEDARVILERVFYLAKLDRLSIKGKILTKTERRRILELFGEGIEDKSFEEALELLKQKGKNTKEYLEIFSKLLSKEPTPTKLTLRSHMTAAWFRTIRDILNFGPPPWKLFSIDWVFRREQRMDEKHLFYYHSASLVIINDKLSKKKAIKFVDSLIREIGIKKFKIVKKIPASYYDSEWEIYHIPTGLEFGDFGFYSKRALRNYKIKHKVFNLGLGLERLAQIIFSINDIRKVLFRHRYQELADLEIKKGLRIKESPKTKWGKRLYRILLKKVADFKDKIGPFKELVYEDNKVKVFFLEPDRGKRFLGPAAFNYIVVKNGNIVSSTRPTGLIIGKYIDLILRRIVARIERKKGGIYSIGWVNSLSDVNLEINPKVSTFLLRNNKKTDVKGPVFFDTMVEFQK